MEHEFVTPDRPTEEELMQREERCRKAIKTVFKAILMRILVMAILLWVFFRSGRNLMVLGVVVLVLVINGSGLLPLTAELKKQKKELKRILSLYE